MKPADLVNQARRLARASPKRPRDVDLRRAVSAAYYALFHTIGAEAADLLVGTAGSKRSNKAWRQVYRALQHGEAKTRCESLPASFGQDLLDVAAAFVELQKQRHDADYDPMATFSRRTAENYILMSEDSITKFLGSAAKDRRAFVIWLSSPIAGSR